MLQDAHRVSYKLPKSLHRYGLIMFFFHPSIVSTFLAIPFYKGILFVVPPFLLSLNAPSLAARYLSHRFSSCFPWQHWLYYYFTFYSLDMSIFSIFCYNLWLFLGINFDHYHYSFTIFNSTPSFVVIVIVYVPYIKIGLITISKQIIL